MLLLAGARDRLKTKNYIKNLPSKREFDLFIVIAKKM
jgi:hypothetical protein